MVARIVLTFSLLMALTAVGLSQVTSDLAERLAEHPETAVAIVKAHPELYKDPDLAPIATQIMKASPAEIEDLGNRLGMAITLRTRFTETDSDPSAVQEAIKVKSTIGYRDTSLEQESNWLGRALQRLKNLIPKFKEPETPDIAPVAMLGDWVTFLLWALLIAGVVALVVFGLRHFVWKRGLARRAKAMLEDDEPERTLDEWLEQADALARDGKHREAVRALYLACLLRFDEHRVARFIRGETNWEHLYRIQRSPNLPPDLDFRPTTQAFDRIWYGYQIRGQVDVDMFRGMYQQVTDSLARKAA